MRKAASLVSLVAGILLTMSACTEEKPPQEVRIKVDVLVSINVCRQAECVTVPLPQAEVEIQGEEGDSGVKQVTGPDGRASFSLKERRDVTTVTARSPLLSAELKTDIKVEPEANSVSVELTDPKPAELDFTK
jgi:hypothetical protein